MRLQAPAEIPPSIINTSVGKTRTRKYLTEAEVERLMKAASKHSRHGHRDVTMILIGFRHGLRAAELCDLMWSQVELGPWAVYTSVGLNPGRRATHPMQGDEIRALRRLTA